MDKKAVKKIVKEAVKELIKNEKELFTYNVREEAFSARLAMLLKEKIEKEYLGLKVDCEYNKEEDGNPKKLICFDNFKEIIKKLEEDLGELYKANAELLKKLFSQKVKYSRVDLEDKLNEKILEKEYIKKILDCIFESIRPDIIVHKRGSHNNNTLAIEIKKGPEQPNNKKKNEAFKHDRDKLRRLTSDKIYHYKFGLFLILNTESPLLEWYENGKKNKPEFIE